MDRTYLGLGVRIGVVNGPIPAPSPNVKHPLGAISFRAESKLAAKSQQPQVMLDLWCNRLGDRTQVGRT